MFSRAQKTPLVEWWFTVDRTLLAAILLLMMFGMGLSFAASPPVAERLGYGQWYFTIRHFLFLFPAIGVMLGTSLMTLRQIRWTALAVLIVSIGLLALTLKFGVEIKGARRWLLIFGTSVQPSEFVKPAFAVIIAWLFAEHMQKPDMPARLIAFAILATILSLLMMQPDFGQTVLITLTFAAVLFISGISWWLIMGFGVAAAALSTGAYALFPHVARRVDLFLNPESIGNYQVNKALQSLLEGGWFGQGPGEAIVRRYVPDAHADFVFSAAAGEFGILFSMLLVFVIGFVVVRALWGAQQRSNIFARLAISALALQFGMQAIINLMVNLSLLPPKGMTLPFVSYGGTSMIATAFGMGMVLSLTRRKPEERQISGLPAFRGAVTS
ncbi:MAG: cell division protein FtsW [Hyphomicrobiaceae bacterium]|nr:cell division protein FtsW [Hyphomicrobiaceae bacterium]